MLLSRVLAAYGQRHPDVRVEIEELDFSEPSADVRSARTDVAFVCAPIDATGLSPDPPMIRGCLGVVGPVHGRSAGFPQGGSFGFRPIGQGR